MNLALVKRYRKHVEYSIWLLLFGILAFVNIVHIPAIQQNLLTLNLVLAAGVLYTLIYYHVIAPRLQNEITVLSSILAYTVLVLAIIHLSGSMDSILFALVFVPILVSALLIGIKAMVSVILLESVWLIWEFLSYSATIQALPPATPQDLFWERLIAIFVVAFVSYTNSKEIFTRQYEHEQLIKERNHIRQLQKREDIILGSIDEIVLALTSQGSIIFGNRAFYKAVEKEYNSAENEIYTKLFLVYEVDNLGNKLSEVDLTKLSTQKSATSGNENNEPKTYKLVAGDKEIFVDIQVSKLKSGTDTEGVVLVMRDISEEKQLELMKLDFVSMAAHELRTPITAIRGYIDMIKVEAWDKLNNEERTFIKRADIAALQLLTLMENLLSASKIEQGTYNLNLAEIDWIQLLENRVEEFSARANERNLKIKLIKPKGNVPKVYADSLRITEVLNNLISNAINYTQKGSITVSAEYDKNSEEIITKVKDTGQGIPEEALEHLFEKFFRVSGVLEQGSKGTGLGLYISKQIVELHHGKIWVESEYGKGSTFIFSLPTVNNPTVKEELE